MTSTKKTYSLSKIRQLIDLNGDSTNFDITFNVASKNGEPFEILVVDQTTLDNSPDIEYKNAANGRMSGRLTQDKNVFQNYFLILRALQPCECDVELIKEELPTNTNMDPSTPPENDAGVPDLSSVPQTPPTPSSKGGINWKLWLIIGVIIAGGVALYFIYMADRRKKKANEAIVQTITETPIISEHTSPESTHPSPSPMSSQHDGGDGTSLVARLKRLHMTN